MKRYGHELAYTINVAAGGKKFGYVLNCGMGLSAVRSMPLIVHKGVGDFACHIHWRFGYGQLFFQRWSKVKATATACQIFGSQTGLKWRKCSSFLKCLPK